MTNKDINSKVKKAFDAATPDVSAAISADCGKQPEGVFTNKPNTGWVKRAVAVAAALVLVISGVVGFDLYRKNAVVSTVSIDVNPSISVNINSAERVVEVKALNDDAAVVLGNMDFKGSDVDVAVNAIIGSMLRHGYLSELANSVLVSVDGKGGEQLRLRLSSEIGEMLKTDAFTGAVLSQTVTPTEELRQNAESYGISVGKAALIREIIAGDPTLEFSGLAKLTVNELNLIASGKTLPETVQSSGTASVRSYIGKTNAKNIALSNVGLSSAAGFEIELDYENGVMVYEVEFHTNTTEYDLHINAVTGEVLASQSKPNDDFPPLPEASGTPDFDDFDDDDFDFDDFDDDDFDFNDFDDDDFDFDDIGDDLDDRFDDFEDSFDDIGDDFEDFFEDIEDNFEGIADDLEDGYEQFGEDFVSAAADFIERWESSRGHNGNTSSQSSSGASDGQNGTQGSCPILDDESLLGQLEKAGEYLGRRRAYRIAISMAGVTEGSETDLDVEFETDNGVNVYEIDFTAGGFEYDFTINASTGTVINMDKELDD